MKISKKGIEFIKKQEGFLATPKKDVDGSYIIGYGQKIKQGQYRSINQYQAEVILKNSLAEFEKKLHEYVKVRVSQNQWDALVSFIYNVGTTRFRNSTLLKKLNSGDKRGASVEFPKWCVANGKKNEGLYARREEERKIFLA